MYGFTNVYEQLSVPNVLSKVKDATLWRYYLGTDFQLKKDINSPLRRDKNPSFQLYLDNKDRVKFKDHGGQGLHGDIFDFLSHRDGLSLIDSLVRINTDFKLHLGTPDQQTYKGAKPIGVRLEKQLEKFSEEFYISTAPFIQVITRPYAEADEKYWAQFGITQETLRQYSVYCIKAVKMNSVLVYTYSATDPGYVYHFPKTKHNKCYFPKRDGKYRFLSSANNYEDIQGYYQCNVKKDRTNKLLILTKSMKDVMCLRELGYEAMSIHGETQYFYKDFIRHIKKYYPNIISLYDRDKAGVRGARYLWKEYRIHPYFIPKFLTKEYHIKDISDMYTTLGRGDTEELMKKISSSYTGFSV